MMGRGVRRGLASVGLLAASFLSASSAVAGDDMGPLNLTLRSRVAAEGYGAPRVIEHAVSWEPSKTAVIVCDMWDLHHCLNATRRVNELAPRMDALLTTLRSRGVLVIHAPSSCMETYKDHPARLRAREVSRAATLPLGIEQWCKRIPSEEEAAYPVDQSDGGEDDEPEEHARWAARLKALGRNPSEPWKSETPAITIDPAVDLISDDGREIWSALESKGVRNVMLMGVHLNMCVLGRPFGLRQMAKNGKTVVLIRDLTDTMYNPARRPMVSHFTGTDRVVAHVEQFVCPTVSSDQILGGKPLRFRGDDRPRVVFLVADDEYKTESTLPAFAASRLGGLCSVGFVFDREGERDELTGTSLIKDADVLVVSARRRVIPAGQLEMVRRLVAEGKGVVGIRTASHAFSPKAGATVSSGHDAWSTFDAEVLGGNYQGHHEPGGDVAISAPDGSLSHPMLTGVDPSSIVGHGTLYKVSPLASSSTTLLTGTTRGQSPEPVAWTNLTASGGRVVYTSLGHPDDFREPGFERLLRNAIMWAAGRPVPSDLAESASTELIPFPK